jgi:hypothetical protein
MMRYRVYEASAFGCVRLAAELDAETDREALKQAREVLPHAPGELRERERVICRFGRTGGFLLQT